VNYCLTGPAGKVADRGGKEATAGGMIFGTGCAHEAAGRYLCSNEVKCGDFSRDQND